MTTKKVDRENIRMSDVVRNGGRDLNVHVEERTDDVLIVVTQAFGPSGDSLVGISDVRFDDFPAVTVGVRVDGREGFVHLSPFHGDARKEGMTDIPEGTRCELFCPVSRKPLDVLDRDEGTGTAYHAIYLTPKLSEGNVVAISNVWGDHTSRIVDDFDMISDWAGSRPANGDGPGVR
ncbi:MAG: hypothetical protein EA398_04540 [Deltaproteobacteria bacterium]|nr:MAG: hypothetical protein EA398_04540 [Deltaproteobacteria bacterium]